MTHMKTAVHYIYKYWGRAIDHHLEEKEKQGFLKVYHVFTKSIFCFNIPVG
jgi:hypothetical protein